MKRVRSQLISKSPLEGPPFLIMISEKSKSRLQKFYFSMFILWILHTIIRYIIDDPIKIFSHIFFVLVYIPAIVILLNNHMIIMGDHDNWNILKVKSFLGKHFVIEDIKTIQLNIEIRVVSSTKYSTSLVLLNTQIKKMSIKTPNIQVKEFIDECEIINLKVDIRKRGSINSMDLHEKL